MTQQWQQLQASVPLEACYQQSLTVGRHSTNRNRQVQVPQQHSDADSTKGLMPKHSRSERGGTHVGHYLLTLHSRTEAEMKFLFSCSDDFPGLIKYKAFRIIWPTQAENVHEV